MLRLLVGFFIVCILSSYLFYRRLISRSRALMQNYRDIFARENKPGVCAKRCDKLNEDDLDGPRKKRDTNSNKEEDHITNKMESAK